MESNKVCNNLWLFDSLEYFTYSLSSIYSFLRDMKNWVNLWYKKKIVRGSCGLYSICHRQHHLRHLHKHIPSNHPSHFHKFPLIPTKPFTSPNLLSTFFFLFCCLIFCLQGLIFTPTLLAYLLFNHGWSCITWFCGVFWCGVLEFSVNFVSFILCVDSLPPHIDRWVFYACKVVDGYVWAVNCPEFRIWPPWKVVILFMWGCWSLNLVLLQGDFERFCVRRLMWDHGFWVCQLSVILCVFWRLRTYW